MKKKRKKQRLSGFFLIVAIIGIIVLLGFFAWFTVGEKWYYSTPHLMSRLEQVNQLVVEDTERIASIDEKVTRVILLSSRASNKETVLDLLTDVKSEREAMQETLAPLALETIALEESRLPYEQHRQAVALSASEKNIHAWFETSGTFLGSAERYVSLLLLVVAYKEDAARLTIETLKTAEAADAHGALAAQADAIVVRLGTIQIEEPSRKVDKVLLYFQKVKQYHEKSKAFYEADLRRDLTTQKALETELATLENDLSNSEFISDLTLWENDLKKEQHQLFSPFRN